MKRFYEVATAFVFLAGSLGTSHSQSVQPVDSLDSTKSAAKEFPSDGSCLDVTSTDRIHVRFQMHFADGQETRGGLIANAVFGSPRSPAYGQTDHSLFGVSNAIKVDRPDQKSFDYVAALNAPAPGHYVLKKVTVVGGKDGNVQASTSPEVDPSLAKYCLNVAVPPSPKPVVPPARPVIQGTIDHVEVGR